MNKLFLIAGLGLIAVILLWLLFSVILAPFSASPLFQGGTLAVIPVKGSISAASSAFGGEVGASEVVDQLEQAADDPAVRGILLDIDSPGGGVVPTKQIVYKIREMEKPVVAYIGETGASGGYYIAAASDYIVADEDSLTGSIGVISMVVNIERLLSMWGIDVNVITEGKYKATGSLFTEFREEDRALLETLLAETFAGFKGDILDFRAGKITQAELDEVADGRILSGRQALRAHLIDATGSREEAIRKAAELAGISGEPTLKTYEKAHYSLLDLFVEMGQGFGRGLKAALLDQPAGLVS